MLRRDIAWLARLRLHMLTAPDPAAAARLRGFVQKYRRLAERASEETIDSWPLN
jgi:hypothetical protein